MLGLNPSSMTSSAPVADYSVAGPKEHRFSPYQENHGSVIAVAGDDFAVIASDTRLSGHGYSIMTRDQPKLFPLSSKAVLGSTGCWCDVLTLAKLVEAKMQIYKNTHNKVMSTAATAQMIATMLYSKRFFPYYVSNILVILYTFLVSE
jgi:20S proteasome subunit beta 6